MATSITRTPPVGVVVQLGVGRNGAEMHTTYVDRGCDLSLTCAACRLPRCRYDMTTHELRAWLAAQVKEGDNDGC